MSLPPAHHPDWPKVTLFDDPDEEARVEAMRDAMCAGTFDEAELYLGTPPGFATLLPAFRVSEDDVLALPEILRTKRPIPGRPHDDLNWVVERLGPDGSPRKVVYAARPFKEDGKHRVVTVYIEDPAVLARQGHDPLPLSPDRGGGRRR